MTEENTTSQNSSIPLLKFNNLSKFDSSSSSSPVLHGISTRHGGVSTGPFASLNLGLDTDDLAGNVQENYRRFLGEFSPGKSGRSSAEESHSSTNSLSNLCIAYQRHTDNVLVIDPSSPQKSTIITSTPGPVTSTPSLVTSTPGPVTHPPCGLANPYDAVDGFITATPGIALCVRFADCQGVLFFDPVKRVIAAVHSGWRGNAQNILGKCVAKMTSEFDCNPANILIGISPSLGPCCAEFSDPVNELPEEMHKYISEKIPGKNPHVDLWQCSHDQLTSVGIPSENIEIARRCTVCENDHFFSYRGGKKTTGHMAGLIMLS